MYCASKKRLFFLGLAFFIIMCISGIYSLTNEVINSTENSISTGGVDIDLHEYNNRDETFNEDGKIVMPGDGIYLVPRVNNLGVECYLRMKITYTINGKKFSELDYIDGNYSTWDFKDGYYYYGSVFNKSESIDLFNKVSIPNNLANEYQGKKVIVHVIVEAIQAKNFDGNWNGIEIKESIDRSYDINAQGESTVIYENNAESYLTLDEGFFDNLAGLMPGDSVSEDLKILNNSKDDMNCYVSVETNDLTDDELNLLKNIDLIVKTKKGKVKGTKKLSEVKDFLLGSYKTGEGETLVFEISLPKELDNEFSKMLTKITWKFSIDAYGVPVDPEPEPEPEKPSPEEPEPEPEKPDTPEEPKEEIPKKDEDTPKTGDFKFDLSITVFLLSAIGFLVVLFLERKEAEKIENK